MKSQMNEKPPAPCGSAATKADAKKREMTSLVQNPTMEKSPALLLILSSSGQALG